MKQRIYAMDARSNLRTPAATNRVVAHTARLVSDCVGPLGSYPLEFPRRRIIPFTHSAVAGGRNISGRGVDWSRGSARGCHGVSRAWLQIRGDKWRSDLWPMGAGAFQLR